MRTIKFRAKDRWSEIWYYGSLLVNEIFGRTHIWEPSLGYLEVDPETVGQFTGLLDKNGEWIYEGDIYRYDNHPDSINVVSYCAGGGFAGFDLAPAKHNENRLLDVEVIGNIHDNPELLKEELY